MDIGTQLAGLIALLAGIGIAYRVWIRPRATHLNGPSRGLLMLLVLTMLGGLIGSTGWWFDNPSAFSWDLPPLASRMLGSAAVAFAAANLMALRQPSFRRVRLVLLIYLLPLAAAIVLFHLNRFDPTAPITAVFFIVVIGMILAGGWYLLRQPVVVPDYDHDARPTDAITRAWLTGLGEVMGVGGLALFLTDTGSDLIWLWPGDLLTGRLIAAMLLTLCAAALYSRRFAEPARITLVVIVIYGLGVIVSNLINLLGDKPLKPVYIVVFGVAGLISAGLLFRERTASA